MRTLAQRNKTLEKGRSVETRFGRGEIFEIIKGNHIILVWVRFPNFKALFTSEEL